MTQVVNVSSALCCARGPQMVTADPGARDACCAPPVSEAVPAVDSAMSLRLGPVHARHADRPLPAPGAPLCAASGAFPFRLFEDSMQRRVVEGRGDHMGSSAIGCCSSQGHSVLPGQHCEDGAMCCCGASLGAAPPQRGWLTCASVPTAPRAVAVCVLAADGPSPGQPGSRNKSCPSVFPHRPCLCSHENLAHVCCRPAAHTCSCAPRSWHTGRPARRPDSA